MRIVCNKLYVLRFKFTSYVFKLRIHQKNIEQHLYFYYACFRKSSSMHVCMCVCSFKKKFLNVPFVDAALRNFVCYGLYVANLARLRIYFSRRFRDNTSLSSANGFQFK